jgi:streptomycin 6-kinase
MSLNESKKRDFIAMLIVIMEQNAGLLAEKGYDPTNVIAQLKEELAITDQKEARQRETVVAAKNATQEALEALNVSYKKASATVDLISGLLGKDDNLLKEIKKLRKTTPPPPKPDQPD